MKSVWMVESGVVGKVDSRIHGRDSRRKSVGAMQVKKPTTLGDLITRYLNKMDKKKETKKDA